MTQALKRQQRCTPIVVIHEKGPFETFCTTQSTQMRMQGSEAVCAKSCEADERRLYACAAVFPPHFCAVRIPQPQVRVWPKTVSLNYFLRLYEVRPHVVRILSVIFFSFLMSVVVRKEKAYCPETSSTKKKGRPTFRKHGDD